MKNAEPKQGVLLDKPSPELRNLLEVRHISYLDQQGNIFYLRQSMN